MIWPAPSYLDAVVVQALIKGLSNVQWYFAPNIIFFEINSSLSSGRLAVAYGEEFTHLAAAAGILLVVKQLQPNLFP
jgi:hypothetical protein